MTNIFRVFGFWKCAFAILDDEGEAAGFEEVKGALNVELREWGKEELF